MHHRLESLESRRLLAFTGNFTDVDGDQYQISLTGPGDVQVTTSEGGSTGFIDDLQITNTTAASVLKISLLSAAGNGRVEIFNLHSTVVKSFDAKIADARDNGNIWFDDANSVNFGDVNDVNFRLNLDAQAGFTKRTVVFQNLKSGSLFSARGFIKSFAMQSANDTVIIYGEGAGTVTCAGDFIGGFITDQFGPIFPIGSFKAGGVARINGVTGSFGSISAQSFLTPPASNSLLVQGTLGKLTSTGGNAGRWKANNYGTVSGTDFTGELKSAVPDANGLTFKSIKFTGAVTGGVIDTFDPLPATGVDGVIGSLSVGSWSGGNIRAAGMKQFKVAGNLQNPSVWLSGVTLGLTMGSMKVGGEVSGGTITVLGNAGPITLGSAANGNAPTFTDGATTSVFKSITLTSKTVVISAINVNAGSLGALTSAHGFIGSNLNFDAVSGFALKTFKAVGQLQSVEINAPSTVGMDSFSARGFFNSTWNVGFINSINLGPEFKGASGGMSGATINLTGANPLGLALKTMVSGDPVNGQINATAPGARIGSVTVKRFEEGSLSASTIGSVTATDKIFPSTTLIQATGSLPTGISIGSLDFRGGLEGSEINAAGSIDKFSALRLSPNLKSYITAGNSSLISGFPANLNGFAIASINQIRVTGAFSGDPVFAAAVFAADTIGKVTINGRSATDGAEDFGFVARHYGPFSLKLASGSGASPVIGTSAGDYNVLAPDANGRFIVRVVA